jgi:orsellinic acid C2-O-methyltransferase
LVIEHPDRARLLALIGSSWRTQAVHAMVCLGLADSLSPGPASLEQLARLAGADVNALSRLLRALDFLGLVEQHAGGWTLTPMGGLLRSDSGHESLADWVRWWGGEVQWRTWGSLGDAVRQGRAMREHHAAGSRYELHATSQGAAHVFHSAMGQLSASVGPTLLQALSLIGPCTVADIGGGRGELLASVLKACAEATGVLFEQRHAFAAARKYLEREHVLDRCTLREGDFFRDVPAGADVYLLKSVLHNWDDQDVGRLLRRFRERMTGSARLAIIERALDEAAPTEADLRSDLNMLVALGGRERSLRELQDLLGRCGMHADSPIRAGQHQILICRARSD